MRQLRRNLPCGRAARGGFSLIEMAVVIAIIAAISIAVIGLLPQYTHQKKREITEQTLERIVQSLLDFRRVNGRLPCPADITQSVNGQYFGVMAATINTCTGTPAANFTGTNIAGGMVPVKSLQLPDEAAFDGYGSRIFYAVDTRMTNPGAFGAYLPGDETVAGSIRVNDANGNSRTRNAAGTRNDMAVYILISFGENAHGAYTRATGSARVNRGNTDAATQQNAHYDSSGAETTFDGVFVQKPSTSSGTAVFDDIVVFKTRADLRDYYE